MDEWHKMEVNSVHKTQGIVDVRYEILTSILL